MPLDELKYPIGLYEKQVPTPEVRKAWIEEIEGLPARLRGAVAGLTNEQLNTPYRPDGWTVRQVVHHLADSHMNSFIRIKLALTEDVPTIKPYEEQLWAELADSREMEIEPSLALLAALHDRWTTLLRSLSEEQWAREFIHPASGRTHVADATGLYAWHSRHHTAHITRLCDRMGWKLGC